MTRCARLVIIWHSRTGASQQLVHAMAAACSVFAIELVAVKAQDATAQDVLNADGILFVAPENLASLSGAMKEFFDRCYYDLLDQIAGKAFGIIIAAGSDGMGAVRQLQRIATGLRLRAIAEPVVVLTFAQSKAEIMAPKQLDATQMAPAIELAQTLAAGLAAGIY